MEDNIYPQAPVVAELMRLGFGLLDYIQEPGLLVRYSAVPPAEGASLRDTIYVIEVVPVPVPDALWPKSRRRKKLLTKWWKNPILKKAVREMLSKFELLSPDVPQQFRTTSSGELIPGSVQELTEIS
ncbi:hypothetical protein KKD95_01205 [Patescibacteria group bacterium]|nr:hypothetical protein [Patescibacteria group bacterium]